MYSLSDREMTDRLPPWCPVEFRLHQSKEQSNHQSNQQESLGKTEDPSVPSPATDGAFNDGSLDGNLELRNQSSQLNRIRFASPGSDGWPAGGRPFVVRRRGGVGLGALDD